MTLASPFRRIDLQDVQKKKKKQRPHVKVKGRQTETQQRKTQWCLFPLKPGTVQSLHLPSASVYSVVLLKHLESTSPYRPVTGSVSKRTTWIRPLILSPVPVLLITHNNNNTKTHPDILLIRSWVVLWSCSLDFKVAWLCCCNFIFSQNWPQFTADECFTS